MIHDQFTDLPVSRQRKKHLRNNVMGLCAACSRKLDGKSPAFCEECRTKRNKAALEHNHRSGKHKRYYSKAK